VKDLKGTTGHLLVSFCLHAFEQIILIREKASESSNAARFKKRQINQRE
jgi:hypothetical protein